MKNFQIVLVSTFLIGITIFSCTRENLYADENVEITSNELTPKLVGEIHTDLTLETMRRFSVWKIKYTNGKIYEKLYDEILIKETSKKTGVSNGNIEKLYKEKFALTKDNIQEWSIYDIPFKESKQEQLFDQIMKIVKLDLNNEQFKDKLDEVRKTNQGRFDIEYLEMIIEVSISSYTYWNENYSKWINPSKEIYRVDDKDCAKEKIVGGDVKGAIVGGVAGAITGAGALLSGLLGAVGGTLVGTIDAIIRC